MVRGLVRCELLRRLTDGGSHRSLFWIVSRFAWRVVVQRRGALSFCVPFHSDPLYRGYSLGVRVLCELAFASVDHSSSGDSGIWISDPLYFVSP